MKHYSLFLFTLSLATLQASESSDQELNNNNTNEKSDTSSTYIHGQQEDSKQWIDSAKYEDLKKPLIKLYNDGIARPTQHIITPPPVYFIIGPAGAGKSTSIFALQGNDVEKNKQSSRNFDSDPSSEDEMSEGEDQGQWTNIGSLKIRKTIDLPTPEMAASVSGVTKGVKIYYTGKKKEIETPMAFCDTEGFLGEREINNNTDKFMASFALSFALKTNTIGGIVFLVSSEDITSTRGRNFHECAHLLKKYFDLAVLDENLATLKKSIMLLITKERGEEMGTVEALAGIIKASYQDYHKGIDDNTNQVEGIKDHNNERDQGAKTKAKRIGQLKPFFSLFLKNDVNEHEIDTITAKLVDTKNVRFFYPYEERSVKKTHTKLLKLQKLFPDYLSLQNDRNTLALIQKIMDRAYAINNISHKVLEQHNLAQLQRLLEQNNNRKKLQELEQALQQRKKRLKDINHDIIHSALSVLIHQVRHQESLPLARKGGYKKYVKEKTSSWSWFWSPLKYIYHSYVQYVYDGYLRKEFTFSIDNPIYTIKIETKNKGNITWTTPGNYFIQKKFKKKNLIESNTKSIVVLEAIDKHGIKQNEWKIYHFTAYEQDAHCSIKFFSKKNFLKANNLKIDDNEQKIERIDKLLNKKAPLPSSLLLRMSKLVVKNSILFNKNIKKPSSTKEKKHENLTNLQEEMNMIACWSNHIFEQGKQASKELIDQYMKNYHEAVACIQPLSVENTNINSKHSDNQPGQQLDLEDQEEQKEDDDNHNTSSKTSLNAVVTLSITGTLASLLKKN